jgi:hypothetical protein
MVLTTALIGLAFLATAALPAQAGLLVGWDFSGITATSSWGPSPMTPTQSDANVTVVGLTRNWTTGTGTPGSYGWGGNNFAQSPNNTQDGALAAGNYATFSLTANPGYELSFTDIPAYNIRHSASGPSTGIWQYQVGSSGAFTDISSPITWGSVTTSAGNPQAAIDLSGISALQNVAAGTTVTFRCVTWGATSTGGTWYLNSPSPTTVPPGPTQPDTTIDFAVNGTANPVPEPSAIALLVCGLGGVGLAVGRQWRKKTAK